MNSVFHMLLRSMLRIFNDDDIGGSEWSNKSLKSPFLTFNGLVFDFILYSRFHCHSMNNSPMDF